MATRHYSGVLGTLRGRRTWPLLSAVLAALALALPLAAEATATPAGGAGGRSGPPGAGGSTGHGAGGTYAVTLITGDVALLQVAPNGQQSAWVQRPAAGSAAARSAQVYEQDGQVHVVPDEAAPYLRSGALDPNLFNVTLLVREGFSDATSRTLPLLVQSRSGSSARTVPAAPSGTRKVRTLDSIATVSVTADKATIETAWRSLRGARAASLDATDARLATAGRVWLNGKVRATVQDGAEQIGAPDAWRAGYDGHGVHVAVLDTGYDPTHPDLRGRVTKERNFTAEVDPPGETAVDGFGHGTHVAATIAGTGKASHGRYEGVAPGADLWIGKVLDSAGNGNTDQAIAGMQWAADSGADVINMSLGTPSISDGTDPMSEAVNQLTESSGALFVIAAGNSGPGEQTVTAPGAADSALTVGAVDGNDQPASFSSRGPRYGDLAVKPEIVAPGVDVVSARAAGTSMGNLLDRYYTAASGTSMATPHVAGSAAILAQRHPTWDAARLKTQLVATSKTLAHQSVVFQGAGRVDVAAAIRDRVSVGSAVLSLGHVPQDTKTVRRTLTYTNPTGRPVRLRLQADVHGTGVDERVEPELVLGRSLLTVPAHGRANVPVVLYPSRTRAGYYAGQLVAHADGARGAAAAHSVISFAVDGRPHTLTVHAVDRTGAPAGGPVDLWNEDTGEANRIWLANGTATAQVPDGNYTMMAGIQSAGNFPTTQTVAGDPQLRIHADTTLDLDARDGHRVTVDTPRDADLDYFRAEWTRTVGGRSFASMSVHGGPGQQLYVIPSKKATRGTFEFATQWQFVQPLLVAETSGPHGERVSPTPRLASYPNALVGHKTLPLVLAGNGTPEAFAGVAAQGKIALVTRNEDIGLFGQVQAAKAAGVAVLLVQNTDPGVWHTDVHRQGLPAYTLTQSAGDQLQHELESNPAFTLDLTGRADSTYAYELVFPESRVPAKVQYRAEPSELASVVSDYRQNSSRMVRVESWIPHIGAVGFGNSMAISRIGPVVRTDYVSTRGVAWQRFGQPDEFANMYWTWSGVATYHPGDRDHQVWWGPLVTPGVPPISGSEAGGAPVARFRDAIRILMPHYFYGGTRYGFIQEQLGDTSQLELRRGGEVIAKSSWPVTQFTVPAKRAQYELALSVRNGKGNFADTSTATESTWRFQSARSSDPRTVLPLVQLGYDIDTNGYNEVPAGATYPLTITPGYQPGATGPAHFTVRVQVSYDDGETWRTAAVTSTRGRFNAQVPAASGSGFATVRVVATDADGNRLTQQVERAWRVSTG